ncbi:UDP-glucosyltransferase 2-like [Xylocopa sonorina]|uniref:UDP-glucosyltransferase 2-like n=1 Tax=Xylocopa sonorina TaxID=1818115 RepID=UPI00403A9432
MRHHRLLFYLILALATYTSEAGRILCVFPYNGRSHFRMFGPICKTLARKGHQVDMISFFPAKKPIANYTDIIDLSVNREKVSVFSIEYAKNLHDSVTYYVATTFGGKLCELMNHESMQKLIKNPPNDPPYDLVITEYFGSPCYIGLGELLKVPVVIAVSFLEMPYVDLFMANPWSDSYFPSFTMNKASIDTFTDRLNNFIAICVELFTFNYYTSDQTEMMRKYLGLPDIDDIREVERSKTALALVNSHYSFHGVRPTTPAIVEVGGLHIYGEELLPDLTPELKRWIDSANHGLVYFSLGSLLAIETLPTHKLLGIYASFSKISPVKILMRCNNATKLPPGLPSNIMTLPWIPQTTILKHKNTRAFITHGGLMGTQEAFYYGIPMIGIPIFTDQAKNVNILVNKKMAILLPEEDITEQTMSAALDKVLHDPMYRESAKKASRIFRDRPMNPLDEAVFWVEYVIRNGPESLRSKGIKLSWLQFHQLDVYAFLIVCFILAIYLSVVLLKLLVNNFRSSHVSTEKKVK